MTDSRLRQFGFAAAQTSASQIRRSQFPVPIALNSARAARFIKSEEAHTIHICEIGKDKSAFGHRIEDATIAQDRFSRETVCKLLHAIGPELTSRDVRDLVANRAKADVRRPFVVRNRTARRR
jgi:hypothetical protein